MKKMIQFFRFIKVITIACNPLKPDIQLTWKEAWRRAEK